MEFNDSENNKMGASGSTEGMPAQLQVSCKREEVCGIYRMRSSVVEIAVKKTAQDELGISVDDADCIISVRENSPADKAGVSKHVGRKFLNRDEVECESSEKVKLRIEGTDILFHNKLPVWSNGNSHLYSTREGKWMLTDSEEGVTRSSGHSMTSQHCGKSPDKLDWMVAENKVWAVDSDFAVWELLPKPEFKVGQLVEFSRSVSSTNEEYRPGLICSVKLPSEIRGNETQYSMFQMYFIISYNVILTII